MNPSSTPSRKSWPKIFLCAAFFLGAAHAAHGQFTIWTNPGAGDWFDGGNWNNGVPNSSNVAIVNVGGTSQIATGAAAQASGLVIGNGLGTGTLEITDGSLQVGSHISLSVGGSGTLYVSGSSASLTQTDGLFSVGTAAAGVLTVRDGGVISNASGFGLTLGGAGGSGTLNLEGTAGSRGALETRFVEEGDGSGEINFDGGILRALSSQSDFLRNFETGDVTINAGGAFIDSNNFAIGISAPMDGAGGLAKIGVGTLILTGANTYAGGTTVNSGTLAVFGGGSITHIGADTRVGNASGDSGTLTIGSGGTVSNNIGYIGYEAGSEGVATVNGTWSNSDSLFVGYSGTGTLTIGSGGTVSSAAGYLGVDSESEGTATVNGGAWSNSDNLYVGHDGTGTLNIGSGGTVSNSDGVLGFFADSEGTATVSGGSWSNDGILYVGYGGTGTLNIENGGLVSAFNVVLASSGAATGSLHIESDGVLRTRYIEEGNGSGGGTIDFDGGILRASANGSNFLQNFETGDVTLNAGGASIDSNGFDIGISARLDGVGGLTKLGAGTLTLNAANIYSGGSFLQQGTLAIGNNAALGTGALTINGGTLATNGSAKTIGNNIVVGGDFSIYPRGTLISISSFRLNGNVDLGGAFRTITNPSVFSAGDFGEVRFDGVFSNGGVYFNSNGTSDLAAFSLRGTGANVYSGLTRLGYGVSLQLLKPGGVIAIPGDAQVDDNGVIAVDANEQIADTSTVTLIDRGRLQIGAFQDVTETIGSLMGNGEVALKDSDDGGSIVISQGSFSGKITGGVAANTASVRKTGSGTLTLSGDSTYLGETQIDAGTLIINGTLGDTDVTVSASAFLQGIGTAHGSVTSNGTIAPGNSPGVLAVGELILTGTSVLDFELGTASDRIDVVANSGGLGSSGNLTLDGTLNITNSGGFGEGDYLLITYDGDLTNSGLDFGVAPGGYDLAIDTSTDNEVNLNVTAVAEQYWDGSQTSANDTIDGGDGDWDNTNTNWTNSTGTVNGEWVGLGAVFGGAPGTVNVLEDVNFRSMRFEEDYSLTGSGSVLAVDNTAIVAETGVTVEIENVIGGDAGDSVEIRGGGVVALYGANTYGGGTLLSEGTLRIENDSALGTGEFFVQNGPTIASIDGFDIANRTFLQGDVTLDVGFGGGTFSGQTMLGNANRTLAIDGLVSFAGAILGGADSGVTLTSSTMALVLISGADDNSFGFLRIGANVGVTLAKDPGVLGISGDLRIDDGGELDVFYAGGDAPIASTTNLHLDGRIDFDSSETLNITLASLTGGATGELCNFCSNSPLNLTILSGDYAGIIYDALGSTVGGPITLIKDGDGTLTLSGANTYSGPTLINGGRLIAASNSAISNTAVMVDGAASVLQVNAGVALSNALQLDNRGTLDNFGTYSGNLGIGSGGGTVVNRNGGRINGSIASNGDAVVNLYSGSSITGDIDFGNHESVMIFDGARNGVVSKAIGGNITGDYALVKTGSTDWTIDRSLDPTLNTSIQDGSLIIGQNGDLKGDIENEGALVFARNGGPDYTFTGSVGGSGRVIQDGTSNTILVGEMLHTGGTEINGGALTVGDGGYIQGDIQNDGKFYIDRKEEDFIFEGRISGSGQVIQDGTSNTFLIGEQTYTGTTYVNSGGLILGNGDGKSSLAGDVIVDDDAYFGGTGEVGGNITVAGTISAGNSPGTLFIRGNFTLESTAILLVEIDSAKDYDRLVIRGKARLDGKLRIVLAADYDPALGTEFEILSAKSLSGQFDAIEASAMWDLVYGPDSLSLVFGSGRQPYQFYAETPNQYNVALALETLRTDDLGRNTDFDNNIRPILDALTPVELRQAFEAIIPNQSVAFSDTLFARSRSFLPQMAARLADIRAGSRGFVASGFNQMGAADMKDVLAPVPENKGGVWVDGSGVFSEVAGFDGLRTGDASSASATVGVDYRLSGNFTAGFYTGYNGSWTDFGGNSEVDSNGSRFGLYSTYRSGGFYLNNLIGGEWNSYDWSRGIRFPGIDRTATADTEGSVFETMFGGGYDWQICEWGTIGGFTSVEYTLLFVDGFTETGAGALNLKIQDQDADSLRTNLGLQFTGNIPVGQRRLRPSLRAAWRHEYLDGSRRINSTLVGGAGPGFSTLLPGGSRQDSLLLNGGFSMDLTENISGYLYYTGDIAGGETENIHAVNAGLRVAF